MSKGKIMELAFIVLAVLIALKVARIPQVASIIG